MATPGNKTENRRQSVDYTTLESVTITFNRPEKWYMYIAKQALRKHEQIDLKAGSSSAVQCVRVAEALKKLGYVTYVKYETSTIIDDKGRLQRFIIIKVKKTPNFDSLYEEREKEKLKRLEEMKKKEEETKK